LKDFLIALLVAVMIASSINPLATKLYTYKIPRAVTVLSVLLIILSVFFGIVALLVPLVSNEVGGFFSNVSEFQNRFFQSLSIYTGDPNFLNNTIGSLSTADIGTSLKSVLGGVSSGIQSTAGVLFTFMFQLVIILVISFYLGVQERGVEKFLRIITPLKHEDYIISLWERSQEKIVSWVKGQMILALIVGAIVYIGLTFIGVPHALLFALLAAVFETIPIVGMTLATIPAVLVALITGGTPMFIATLIFYLILGQAENHVLSPLVVNRVVGLPSIVVIISLIIGGTLMGFWGVLIAVPVSAAIMEFINDIESDKVKARSLLNQ
jgi:predicted PurR-regulated permease PerM